jgi:hypothetical protein
MSAYFVNMGIICLFFGLAALICDYVETRNKRK